MSPRLARLQLATYTYFHVCVRGNGGQPIFIDDSDRLRYLSRIEKYRQRFNLQCFSFCLMTNHAHLLFLSPSIQILSKSMHAIQVAYVMYFNRRHQQRGHLFQDRFSSWVLKNEEHLFMAKAYIENNPVQAGLVRLKEDYLWSSASRDTSYITLSKIIS